MATTIRSRPAGPVPAAVSSDDVVLDVRDLGIRFGTGRGSVEALSSVSFSLRRGRTLALVGESGSGKSTTGLATMGLHTDADAASLSGSIVVRRRDGSRADVLSLSSGQLRRLRGREIAMVFQEPMSSLNPIYTVGSQIREAIELHEPLRGSASNARAVELLASLGVPDPAGAVSRYPHELSGGMRQRVMIAMALACRPSVLIADEPTTALDVTIQAQILELLVGLQKATGMAMLFITHNLGVVREVAHDVAVMYGGAIVEAGPVDEVFARPRMPYTRALLRSLPSLRKPGEPRRRLTAIRGSVPSPQHRPSGCYFHPRCDFSRPDLCDRLAPHLEGCGPDHVASCHLWREIAGERPS